MTGRPHTELRRRVVETARQRLAALGKGSAYRFVELYEDPVGPSARHSVDDVAPGGPRTPVERSWLGAMRGSALQLAPQGVNPTSFRLFEALQLGLTPVYVFEDGDEQPWLPYHDYGAAGALDAGGALTRVSAPAAAGMPALWHRVGVVIRESQLPAFVDALPALATNLTWLAGKRAYARAARDAHFTYEAVTRQVVWLLRAGDPREADLKCAQPPVSFYSEAERREPRPAAAWG